MLALSACGGSRPPAETSSEGPERYRIVGYVLGSKGVAVRPADARRLTHLNYAFANVRPDGTVVLEDPQDAGRLDRLGALKKHNPDLKLLLSIGGWAWSDHFSDAARTQNGRKRFARSAVALLRKHDLDGLDIDWEYPGQPGQGNTYRDADRENFTRLLRTLRTALDAQSARDDRAGEERYLLTIAAGAGADFLAHTNMRAAQRHLDFVNLMTYDFRGSWSARTGHHANLYAAADSLPSAAASVARFREADVPARKLVLGVPFYGRGWGGVRRQHHGLRQPYDGAASSYSHDTLATHLARQDGFERRWDAAAQAPYLWHADSARFISYENERSLARKAAFVRRHGLGGVMFWEYHHDTNGALLSTLYQHLR